MWRPLRCPQAAASIFVVEVLHLGMGCFSRRSTVSSSPRQPHFFARNRVTNLTYHVAAKN
jgi:hypothetical protein